MAAALFAGRYRLQENLSSTQMAEVWLTVDRVLDRRVVVKLLAPGADRVRFEREARAVATLGHPNIVELFDFGEEPRWFMVFEYLVGGSLDERLTRGVSLSYDEIVRLAEDVAAGLAHAHDHGVVHRDLKPGNILFDAEGRSKIADFGIARVLGTDTFTDAGTVLGTAAYISPEQVRGEPATPATDIYSFGVIMYQLLAGRLPFEAESATELAALHRDADPPPLRTGVIAPVAMAALEKDPLRRPADGAALLDALDGASSTDAATTQILRPPQPPPRSRRRTVLIALSTLLVSACGVAAAILLTDRPTSAPAVPPTQSTHAGTTPSSPKTARSISTATASSSSSTSNPRRTTSVGTATLRTTTTAPVPSPAPPPSTAITTQPPTTTATTTTTVP